MKVQKFKRGQIWWYKAGTSFDGSIQGKSRPVIIMSNDFANEYSSVLLAIPCTTSIKKNMPTHLSFEMYNVTNTALAENLMSINIDKIGDYIGTVDDVLLKKLEEIMQIALGLNISNLVIRKDAVDEKPVICTDDKELIIDNTEIDKSIDNKPKRHRKSKFTDDDRIRFLNDYETHTNQYMCKKYNINNDKALYDKVYMFRKKLGQAVIRRTKK